MVAAPIWVTAALDQGRSQIKGRSLSKGLLKPQSPIGQAKLISQQPTHLNPSSSRTRIKATLIQI